MIALPSSNRPSAAHWYPLKPEPSFRERVWGQRDLSFLYPSRPVKPEIVGEVWLTADDNRIGNGAYAGKTLGELCSSFRAELLGGDSRGIEPEAGFPLLIKFLFTSDKLSVQVHPPDEYARQRENSAGKTEMWHVLRAEPGAKLAIGFRQDLPDRPDRNGLAKAIENGAIEQMLHWTEPHEGDTFFIPARTVHAIGAGLVICEIQQNSDVTYRLYDYKRTGGDGKLRELHVDKALDVIEWRTRGGLTQPFDYSDECGARRCIAACPYFITERIQLTRSGQHSTEGRVEIWIGIAGEALFQGGGESASCKAGEAVVLPAALASFSITPASGAMFLRTYAASLETDVIMPLLARGISEEQLRQLCFPSLQRTGGVA